MAESENIDQIAGDSKVSGNRRILVALDASPHSLATLEIAAGIAARLQAEMHGVFVEDSMLLDLAEYPFVRTTSLVSGRTSTLRRNDLERALKRQAGEARHAITAAASRHSVTASFQVRRGQILAEVASTAGKRDVILISQKTGAMSDIYPGQRTRPGDMARELLLKTRHSILILGHSPVEPERVFAAFDGSAASREALRMAVELVGQNRPRALTVLLLAGDESSAAELEKLAVEELRTSGLSATFRIIIFPTVDKLCIELSSLRPGLLVLGREQTIVKDNIEWGFIEKAPCSMMLVP